MRADEVSFKAVKANPDMPGEIEGQDFPFVLSFS